MDGLMDENEGPLTESTIRTSPKDAIRSLIAANDAEEEEEEEEERHDDEYAASPRNKILPPRSVPQVSTPVRAASRKASVRRGRQMEGNSTETKEVIDDEAIGSETAERSDEADAMSSAVTTTADNEEDSPAKRLFEEMDVNGDGVVTLEEFKQWDEKKRTSDALSGDVEDDAKASKVPSLAEAYRTQTKEANGTDASGRPVDVLVMSVDGALVQSVVGIPEDDKGAPPKKTTPVVPVIPRPSREEINRAYTYWKRTKSVETKKEKKRAYRALRRIMSGKREKGDELKLSDGALHELLKTFSVLPKTYIDDEAEWNVRTWLKSFLGRSEIRKYAHSENVSKDEARRALLKTRKPAEALRIAQDVKYHAKLLRQFQSDPVAGATFKSWLDDRLKNKKRASVDVRRWMSKKAKRAARQKKKTATESSVETKATATTSGVAVLKAAASKGTRFEAWLREKKQEEKRAKKEAKKAKRAKQKAAEEKKKKADAAYKKWCREADKSRRRAKRQSKKAESPARTRPPWKPVLSPTGSEETTIQTLLDDLVL